MRKLLIAAPWVTASGAAYYAVSKWSELPNRMAVTFYMGQVSGWQGKGTFIPMALLLMFGGLALFTALLSRPGRIRVRDGALSDPVEDRRRAVGIMLAAHTLILGLLLPLCLLHVVSKNV